MLLLEDITKILAFIVPMKSVINLINNHETGINGQNIITYLFNFNLIISLIASLGLLLFCMFARLYAVKLLKNKSDNNPIFELFLPLTFSQSVFFIKSGLVIISLSLLLATLFHISFLTIFILIFIPFIIARLMKKYSLKGQIAYYIMQIMTWFSLVLLCSILLYSTLIDDANIFLIFIVVISIRQMASNVYLYLFYVLKWYKVSTRLDASTLAKEDGQF